MNNVIAYLNGQYLPIEKAHISPLDRGFLFGDGVYEVVPVFSKQPFGLEAHIERLNNSLREIYINAPFSAEDWRAILQPLIEKNSARDQWIYIQITRGQDVIRDHQFPQEIKPTIFAVSYPKQRLTKLEAAKGLKVTITQDIRWQLCHIKTTARLAYVLMYQTAIAQGFDESLILNNDLIVEGATSNVFIVQQGCLITPPKSNQLLSGITRDRILQLAKKNNIPFEEKSISMSDLKNADEIWITSSTRTLCPVIECDGLPIGNHKAGPLWEKLWDLYAEEIDNVSLPISH